MRFLFRLSFLVSVVGLLSACASLTDDECRVADWYQIGVSDGAEGRGTDRIEDHRRACADIGIAPVTERWLEGRTRGLRLYCTPEKAYRIARAGGHLKSGCTRAEVQRLTPAYEWGRRYWEYKTEIDEIEDAISEIDHLIFVAAANNESGETAPLLRFYAERSRLNSRLNLLELRQNRYATWP